MGTILLLINDLHYLFLSPDMKRPKSPDWMDSSSPPKIQQAREEEEEEEDEEDRRVAAGHRAKRERRQGSSSATMCQVCNIQLNSSAQAQIHYRGKTHQRRLRRLAKVVSTGRCSDFIFSSLIAVSWADLLEIITII